MSTKIIMSIFLVFVTLILLTSALVNTAQDKCAHNTYPPKERPKIPSYIVNLDLPPEQRWQQVGKEKSKEIANLLATFKKYLLTKSSALQLVINLIDKHFGILVETLPMPYREEIKGLSHASGINLAEIFLYNICYEIFSYCTSIVAQHSNGSLYHVRNLDFGGRMGWENHTAALTEALRPSVISVDWRRNNKTVFKSVNFAGFVGILTAIKPGVLTLTMNLRHSYDGGFIGIIKWLLGDRTGSWMSFLTRRTLEDATSYQQAKQLLTNTTLLAPAYFILAGTKPHEACVITRSREEILDVWNIGANGSTWYILETNYDHWKNASDDRRSLANQCMRNMTHKNVGFSGLFDVLSSKPVLNKGTVYTSLMHVDSSSMETYLQHCSGGDCDNALNN